MRNFTARECSLFRSQLAAWFGLLLLGVALTCLPACSSPSSERGISPVEFLHPPTKAPTPTLPQPQAYDLGQSLDPQGKALSALQFASPDGCMHLEIQQGVVVLDAAGQPPASLQISQDYSGKLPMEAYSVPISYAYRFGPGEFRFSQPVKIVFVCLKNYKLTFLSEMSLGMKGDNGEWQQFGVKGDETRVWGILESLEPVWRYILAGPAPMGS